MFSIDLCFSRIDNTAELDYFRRWGRAHLSEYSGISSFIHVSGHEPETRNALVLPLAVLKSSQIEKKNCLTDLLFGPNESGSLSEVVVIGITQCLGTRPHYGGEL